MVNREPFLDATDYPPYLLQFKENGYICLLILPWTAEFIPVVTFPRITSCTSNPNALMLLLHII